MLKILIAIACTMTLLMVTTSTTEARGTHAKKYHAVTKTSPSQSREQPRARVVPAGFVYVPTVFPEITLEPDLELTRFDLVFAQFPHWESPTARKGDRLVAKW